MVRVRETGHVAIVRRRETRQISIVGLCGPPGAGKTKYRRTHLASLPVVDIADVYSDFLGIDWQDALQILIERLDAMLHTATTDVVVEGFFKPDGQQRAEVEQLAARHSVAEASASNTAGYDDGDEEQYILESRRRELEDGTFYCLLCESEHISPVTCMDCDRMLDICQDCIMDREPTMYDAGKDPHVWGRLWVEHRLYYE
eukprot:scaffold124596_cov41-Prasinocladus_malaysianus.AAC.1